MIRYGLGILVVAGTAGAMALQGCSDDGGGVTPGAGTGGAPGAGGGPGAGGSSAMGVSQPCTGVCCPTDPTCYAVPGTGDGQGSKSPGAECLATRDNTGQDHIQMRQQWIRAMTPAGNTIPLVYEVLSGRTQLPWKACNQSGILGSGGYIQVIDFFLKGTDISQHYSTVGYAQHVPNAPMGMDPATFVPTDTLQNGFCMGTETYAGGKAQNGTDYGLTNAEVGDGAGYPPGLPKPMGVKSAPWNIKPTKAMRLATDFNLATDRAALLAKLDPAGDYGSKGFNGVFFYDDATGTSHGFSPLTWTIVYDATGATHISIPIREAETHSKFNSASTPDCVGKYLADALDPSTCAQGQDPTTPGWGGGDCTASTGKATCAPGEGPASTLGYFLIAELEQIYASDLQATLCVTYPGNDSATSKPIVDAQGFYDTTTASCKTAKWNPSDTTNGLPKGDWCAKTNSAATADCHDAWHSVSYHVFAGAKIKMNGDTPATCSL